MRDKVFHEYYHNEKILRMIEKKFGNKTLEHVVEMVKNPLERDIFNENSSIIIPAGGYKSQNSTVKKPKYEAIVV